jgi:hypothetical protein
LVVGPLVHRGTPTTMFKLGSLYEAANLRGNAAYELTPDGQRFLVNRVLRDSAQVPLTLLTNWTAQLLQIGDWLPGILRRCARY